MGAIASPWIGELQGKKCFRKNDLAAVERLGQADQREPEGKGGHDNTGLTLDQQDNRKDEKEGDRKDRNSSLANLSRVNPPEHLS